MGETRIPHEFLVGLDVEVHTDGDLVVIHQSTDTVQMSREQANALRGFLTKLDLG